MSLNSIQKEDPRTIIQSSKSLTELHLVIDLPLNNSVKDMSNLKEFGRTPHLVDLMLELPNLVN